MCRDYQSSTINLRSHGFAHQKGRWVVAYSLRYEWMGSHLLWQLMVTNVRVKKKSEFTMNTKH